MCLAFCLTSSAGYILNDYMDMEQDRAHPLKKTRPLASGQVSPGSALVLVAVLLVGALLLAGRRQVTSASVRLSRGLYRSPDYIFAGAKAFGHSRRVVHFHRLPASGFGRRCRHGITGIQLVVIVHVFGGDFLGSGKTSS